MAGPWQRITASDEEILSALEEAHTPSLLMALIHLTGDSSLLQRSGIQIQMSMLSDGEEEISDHDRARIRAMAMEALRDYRGNPTMPRAPDSEDIRGMLSFLLNQEVSEDYVEFLTAELSMHGEDAFAQPRIDQVAAKTREQFQVIVIGSGMSGLLAGIRLKQAGICFDIIEKNSDVGGTWYENTYPGCRVDTANHSYSYSFKSQDWPQYFSTAPVLQNYFSDIADEYGLRSAIHFRTEVTAARFNEQDKLWEVEVKTAEGESKTLRANAVISAVGQLNQPAVPDVPGIDRFAGPAFHSARWDHSIDLSGKRVAVIGSGASAFQFVPHIASQADSVAIFQRTPPWVLPVENYTDTVPEGKHWLLNHVPYYAKWFRFSVFWRSCEGMLSYTTVDPQWQDERYHSVSAANHEVCELLVENLREQLGGDEELIEKCTPRYPFCAKRALVDNGAWFQALSRDNVELVTQPIAEITEQGIRTSDDAQRPFDVLVFGTGFKATEFLSPMKIYGLDGVELHDAWNGEPRAYQGITVPGFPNLFCCYGPNTNIVINGSIVFFSECEVRYTLGCMALLMQQNNAAMDVKETVHDAYNRRIDLGNAQTAWGASGVNSWYKNASGRITQNWPFTLLEFWQQSRDPEAADYNFS